MSPVAARHRPVNQVKINVVETETVEAAVEGTFDITDPLRGIPYLVVIKKFSRGIPLARIPRPMLSSFL